VVKEKCAFDEFATVESHEIYFASKIKMLALQTFSPDDTFLRWTSSAHFFAFSP
jgi:hypothetical protein